MKKLKLFAPLLLIAAAIGWYAFRPERLVVNQTVSESLPTAQAAGPLQTIAAGTFHGVAHETTGTATVHKLGDGTRVLRFTSFKTSNGPDVRVYLVAATDAKDSDTVKQSAFVDLGSMKGNIGDQNYVVPDNVDLTRFRAATIWCKRFGVNFGTAPLQGSQVAAAR